jgi:hypothetical protein
MKGALHRGYDGLYVGTGLSLHGGDFRAEVAELLGDHGVSAKWAMPALTW